VSQAWKDALARQESVGEKLAANNQQALATAAATFEQHAASLVRTVGESHTDLQTELVSRDEQRLAVWTETFGSMASKLSEQWEQAGALTATRQQEICETLAQTARDISAQTQAHASETIGEIDRLVQAAAQAPKAAANLQAELAERDQQRFVVWTETLGSMAAKLSERWEQSGAQTASRQQEICETLAQTARDISAQTQAHASETIGEIERLVQAAAQAPKAAANLQAELVSQDQQRLAAWTETLGSMAAKLSEQWEQAGALTATRQQQICETLAQTARDISAQTQAHASDTIGEIERLVQAASEAPKAAAEVVAELRQKLSDSMVRDTAMLQERSRLLETLETLLDAVNHASTEQRTAVDALVATSADLLERVGTRFTDHVEHETGKLGAIAAQVTGSAVEVASLGEAFGAAVQMFGESNDKLAAHLQRIEIALDKSLARSDEQLAYYVAQAREVIDLSVMSQKQIVEDLQRVAGQRASAGADVV
jgi:polyhydroxyalkanoate synthesis regulator phasin